jgi:protein-disulfide isomerase
MAAAAKNRSLFAVIISIVVVVAVVAVAVLVYMMNRQATAPAQAPTSANGETAAVTIDEESGAIRVGSGDQTVTEYIDFICPVCNAAHSAYDDTLSELIANDTITLEIIPTNLLDNYSQGTKYSSRAASAAYCVAENDPDAFYPFMDLLFDNQPSENTEGLSNSELVKLAERAGATNSASCINDETYTDFAAEQTTNMPIMPGASGRATPTILVNDEFVSVAATGFDAQNDLVANLD